MDHLLNLFPSPELYPVQIDPEKKLITFVRMSRDAYRDSTFLGIGAAQRRGAGCCRIRLDDVLFAAKDVPLSGRRVHYIFHTAYCCSTLLARYCELFPSSFVLKEPQLLAQLALVDSRYFPQWEETVGISVKLLTRAYDASELVVIKPNAPCNRLGSLLLEHNDRATATFLMMPLRRFLLAGLKSALRRNLIRYWNRHASNTLSSCPNLSGLDPERLTDAENAAYFWLTNRFWCRSLAGNALRSRVVVLDGDSVADQPRQTLQSVAAICGLSLNEEQIKMITNHQMVGRHSKNLSRPYDASSRQREILGLEDRLGREVDEGMRWAASHSVGSLESILS